MRAWSVWGGTRCLGLAAALGVWALAGSPALEAQADPPGTPPDHDFAAEANSGGMAEVKLGQLAQQKGQSDKVKAFGEKMAMDHGKAGSELKQAAHKSGIQLSRAMSLKDREVCQRLGKLEGAAFDKAYAETMVQDHENDVAAFEREAANGQDESIRDFARRTLPTLKEHLRLAREMAHSVS